MKKSKDHPELFGPAKKAEPKAPAIQRACADGNIAGMPDSFARAEEALRDIERRCSAATATTGILEPARAKRLTDIGAEMRALLSTIRNCRIEVDAMIAGVAEEENLFE